MPAGSAKNVKKVVVHKDTCLQIVIVPDDYPRNSKGEEDSNHERAGRQVLFLHVNGATHNPISVEPIFVNKLGMEIPVETKNKRMGSLWFMKNEELEDFMRWRKEKGMRQ